MPEEAWKCLARHKIRGRYRPEIGLLKTAMQAAFDDAHVKVRVPELPNITPAQRNGIKSR